MPVNYDSIANIYDLVSRIVYGRQIEAAQVCLMRLIPADSRILIVGGGTGWILEKIADAHPQGLTIDYVESSAKMIALSRKKNYRDNTVNFIHLPIEEWNSKERCDVIFTPFLFDNFKADKALMIFTNLNSLLKSQGIWLYADFVYDKIKSHWWQKLLLKIMYLFFRITTDIETQKLVRMDACFDMSYQKEFEAFFYSGFIRSDAYRKK